MPGSIRRNLRINDGEGFAKNLGGNELPNAPHFTTSLSAEYTLPVSEDWAATLHSDFYWQSQSFARVFNDRPYDKIRGYSNVNLALILTSASGWQVLGYLKNVFNTTAITGDFLNSDDTRAHDQRVPHRPAPLRRARHQELLSEGGTTMSELINIRDSRATIRWKLLTSVSAAGADSMYFVR